MSEHTAENDALPMVHPDDALLTMVRVAEGLGHRLPWANALDVWPGRTEHLRYAAENLIDAGLIETTTEGFRLAVTCAAHLTRVIPPGLTDTEPACVTCQDRGVWMDNPCSDCPDAVPETTQGES